MVLLGLAVGVATSLLQTYFNSPWLALVNSASPWLVAPFAVGALERRARTAAVAGLVTCVLEVTGYYVTASLRGFPGGLGYEVLWTVCAIVGGPLFGMAGYLWRAAPRRLRGVGAAALPAAFIAEGLFHYELRLRYTSSAVLFVAIGLAAAVGLIAAGWPRANSARASSAQPSGPPEHQGAAGTDA